MKSKELLVGCVADDFTGASDIASFFAAGGLRTVLTNGVPMHDFTGEPQAVVIALKSRSLPKSRAVEDCLEAFGWLKKQRAKLLYFKYCSTFDSTREGNIGPVVDAVLERYKIPYTILCPALPVNGRTVKDGILYVNGIPLAESPMKDHPLTPMWESELTKLMGSQSRYPCYKINAELLENSDNVRQYLKKLEGLHSHFTLGVDYFEDKHGTMIADIFGDLAFITGGSGLALHIANKWRCESKPFNTATAGLFNQGRLMLAGSCSVATREQVEEYLSQGGKGWELNPEHLLTGETAFQEALRFIQDCTNHDVLVYSTGSISGFVLNQPGAAEALERALAELAVRGIASGRKRLVVAGGETSGAVSKALEFQFFSIGQSVAPGVPMMTPMENPEIRIVLKSGNFGGKDFFCTALKENVK